MLILFAGVIGWLLGRPNNSSDNSQAANQETAPSSNSDIKSLVTYKVPSGWEETSCSSGAAQFVLLAPSGTVADCNSESSDRVVISVDAANNRDCNQLQSVQNVSKHICISEYINGQKSLKAETVYNTQSAYKKNTTINAYYIDTGKAVIKFEYVHDPNSSEYLLDFERLAKSTT